MMNLAVLIDYLIPGGVQLEAIEEVKYLNRIGHNATLLILVNDQKYRTLAKGIPHVFLSPNLPSPLNLTYKLPFFSFFSTTHLLSPVFIPKYFRNKRFDLIISHGSST